MIFFAFAVAIVVAIIIGLTIGESGTVPKWKYQMERDEVNYWYNRWQDELNKNGSQLKLKADLDLTKIELKTAKSQVCQLIAFNDDLLCQNGKMAEEINLLNEDIDALNEYANDLEVVTDMPVFILAVDPPFDTISEGETSDVEEISMEDVLRGYPRTATGVEPVVTGAVGGLIDYEQFGEKRSSVDRTALNQEKTRVKSKIKRLKRAKKSGKKSSKK